MTGPEHYREAEKYIASAQTKAHYTDGNGVSHEELALLRYAQVHAELAKAAAEVLRTVGEWFEIEEEAEEWCKAIQVKRKARA